MAIHNKMTKKEINIIVSGKYSSKELSNMLNRHPETISRIARENNIKLPRDIHRIYNVDEYFFHSWSDDMAYALGFIAADGYVYLGPRNGGMLSIGLSDKDRPHLEKIKRLLNSEHPIRTKRTNFDTYAVRLDIGSRTIAERLTELGIYQNKSQSLIMPDIPSQFVSHFSRGYFDGDGYIRFMKTKYLVNLEISMLGTYSLLSGIKNEFGGKFGSIKISQSQYKLIYGGSGVPIEFGKWLYHNSTRSNRMDRKYDIFWDYLNNYYKKDHYGSQEWKDNISNGNYKVTNRKEVKAMTDRYLEIGNYAQVAREFGLKYKLVWYNIRKELERRGK